MIRQLALLYMDLTMRMPTLLAFSEPPENDLRELLRGFLPVLPRRFHAHLTHSVAAVFADASDIQSLGTFHKVAWAIGVGSPRSIARQRFPSRGQTHRNHSLIYEASYPGNWFVMRMLATGFYFGVRDSQGLTSVAGVHACSLEYKVAALGNIATHPLTKRKRCSVGDAKRFSPA